MRPEGEVIRVGTRKSPLAQAQTDRVLSRLPSDVRTEKTIVESEGDLDATRPLHQMERPGAFTSVLTDAILDGRLDAAVHSLKDLPLVTPPEAPLVAILARDDPADVLVLRDDARDDARPLGLRAGARVGTSAPRRQAQLLAADAEIVPLDVRGNVGTRLKLISSGVLDGLLMAAAAFERMALPLPAGATLRRLDPALFPPGPGQGAIAVQARAGTRAAKVLAALDDPETRHAVEAERALLGALGGGCGLPLGAFVRKAPQGWSLDATFETGGRLVRVAATAPFDMRALATRLETPPRVERPPARHTVAITLEPDAVRAYDDIIAAKGWRAVAWPLLADQPTGAPLPTGEIAWIAATSPRGARHAADAYARHGSARIAALGPATTRALRALGLPVHVASAKGNGASLAEAIAAFPAPPARVLLVQAEDALPDLADGLAARGFERAEWRCYRTLARDVDPPAADAFLLASPSNVRAALRHDVRGRRLLAIGATTEAAMREAGIAPFATLARPTPGALLEVLP